MLRKFMFVLSCLLFLAAIGLFIWLGVGQHIAQLNYDGQYIKWRTIQDVSLWGYMGFLPLVLSFIGFGFTSVL